jgi:hypothetical protein
MIRGIDLFGREAISPNEKKMLKSANKTAENLYSKRFSPDLKDNWGKDVRDLTIDDVEFHIIESIKKGNGSEKRYGAKTIR